jgi:hypothetical protein
VPPGTAGGVTLMTARRAGPDGRQGNSVGQYLCTDLACSLYARGLRAPAAGADLDESLSGAVVAPHTAEKRTLIYSGLAGGNSSARIRSGTARFKYRFGAHLG